MNEFRGARPTIASSLRRRVLLDRVMRSVVSAGGWGIVVSVLGIFLFIVAAVAPLLRSARVGWEPVKSLAPAIAQGIGDSRAVVGDEYETLVVTLGVDGVARVLAADTGQLVEQRSVTSAGEIVLEAATSPDGQMLSATTSLGRIILLPVRFDTTFEEDRRVVKAVVPEPIFLDVDQSSSVPGAIRGPIDDKRNATVAVHLADGRLALLRIRLQARPVHGRERQPSRPRHLGRRVTNGVPL